MNFAYPWTGLATITALIVFIWTIVMVGRARARYGIEAPATAGDPAFERVYRVQMNTLEQLALLLPAMWLAAGAFSDRWAAIGGAVWCLGRIVYAHAYYADAAKRGPGYMLTVAPTFILLILAVFGILRGL